MKFAVYMAFSFITFFHVLLVPFFYHYVYGCMLCVLLFNPLNAELNPIRHLLALLGAHHIFHVSRVRVSFVNYVFLLLCLCILMVMYVLFLCILFHCIVLCIVCV